VFLDLPVALLDLIPVVGSTIGGIIVSLVALSVSLSVAIATGIFYVSYRFFEDYLLAPRVMARTVALPALATVTTTVIGGALLGVIGALVAIPVAAAVQLPDPGGGEAESREVLSTNRPLPQQDSGEIITS
jgi:predicted PurR-regulated permease PerM